MIRLPDSTEFTVAALTLFLAGTCALGQNLLQNPGFESGTGNWFGFGPVTFTSSSAQPHTGSRAALIENRSATWNGVAQSLLEVLQPGSTYRISAWVRLVSGGNQPVQLTIQKVDDGARRTRVSPMARPAPVPGLN